MAKPRFKTLSFELGANESRPIHIQGQFINARSADGTFLIRLDTGEEINLTANIRVTLDENDFFEYFTIEDTSGAANSITLDLGSGKIESDDVTISGVTDVSLAGGTITSTADAACTTTTGAAKLAANATRQEVIVQNVGASNIRVGDTNITATRGVQLVPGQAATLTTTAAIFARTETGTSNLSIVEVIQ